MKISERCGNRRRLGKVKQDSIDMEAVMKAIRRMGLAVVLMLSAMPSWADTFRHRTTGETFTGFRTHKKSVGKVLVFNADQNKLIPMDLSEYEIIRDDNGRRNTVIVVRIEQPEILLSETIAQEAANIILRSADQGPKSVIIQIDLPGGQGAPMRLITEAIATAIDDAGCRVAAYLPGGSYGGAFSAAAVVAIACETIYISPTAAIGAVGPMGSQGGKTDQEYLQFLETYAPDTLASFSVYAATLAQRANRPQLLARALVDKHLSIAEVRTPDGKISLVELSQRQENQTVVRMIVEGLPQSSSSDASPIRAVGKLLSLPSAEAIRWKMADKQVSSFEEMIADMGVSGAAVVNSAGLTSTIQKFSTAKRNLEQIITKIEIEEERVNTLESQLAELEKMALTGTVTREVTRGGQYESYRRGRAQLRDPDRFWNRYYNERDYISDDIPLQDRYGRDIRPRDRGLTGREKVTEEKPAGNIADVRRQLIALTAELIANYQQAIGLARRWPGALPPGVTLDTLQKNLVSAQTLLNIQQRRLTQGY
jgi:ATP-dependent protease ClpP protease subunit